MKKIMIAAMNSGSGKTILTAALGAAFLAKGKKVCLVKCGPDYIDPIFHNRVMGEEERGGRNIDLFLQGREKAVQNFTELTEGAELTLIEGVMGFYDGAGGTIENSSWDIADALDIPVILAVKPSGVALTLAAQLKGLLSFQKESHIRGIILTDCKTSLYSYLKPILERETGLTVFGYLPHLEEAEIPSRHLGLAVVASEEVSEISRKFGELAERISDTIDLDGIYDCAGVDDITLDDDEENDSVEGVKADASESAYEASFSVNQNRSGRVRLAVAYDDAFCFYYRTSLNALRKAGAELCFFSPMRDVSLPKGISGLYLGGGYPELFLKELSGNTSMRATVLEALKSEMPVIAECGGFMYLHKAITPLKLTNINDEIDWIDPSHSYEMVGYLDGICFNTGKLNRFGYLNIERKRSSDKESLLFHEGELIPAHEFHYYESTVTGDALTAQKAQKEWEFGYIGPGSYAGFPHLELGGEVPLAKRFVSAMEKYFGRT